MEAKSQSLFLTLPACLVSLRHGFTSNLGPRSQHQVRRGQKSRQQQDDFANRMWHQILDRVTHERGLWGQGLASNRHRGAESAVADGEPEVSKRYTRNPI